MSSRVSRIICRIAALVVVVSVFAPAFTPVHAATSLTNTYVRLDRMKAATASSLRIVFKTSSQSALTENKVSIKLANYYDDTTGAVANKRFTINATQTVSVATCAAETGATALPTGTTLTAAGDNSFSAGSAGPPVVQPTGKTITISNVSDLTPSTSYCVDLTGSAITNPTTTQGYTGTISTLTSGSALIDTTDVGLRIISDDQIVVSAVVPPTFNFVLDGNIDAFVTQLDPATVSVTSGRTATITTNAAHGWIAWVKDSNQGLTSASAPYTIPTIANSTAGAPETLTAGTASYALDVALITNGQTSGSVTIDSEYNGGSTPTNQGGTLFSTYKPIGTGSGTTNGDVIKMFELAAINGSTPAGTDYTDTLTVVGAGNF